MIFLLLEFAYLANQNKVLYPQHIIRSNNLNLLRKNDQIYQLLSEQYHLQKKKRDHGQVNFIILIVFFPRLFFIFPMYKKLQK